MKLKKIKQLEKLESLIWEHLETIDAGHLQIWIEPNGTWHEIRTNCAPNPANWKNGVHVFDIDALVMVQLNGNQSLLDYMNEILDN